MRSLTGLLIAGILVAAGAAPADTATPVPKPKPPAARPTLSLQPKKDGPTEVTEALGDVPQSLAGTWFAVMNVKFDDQYHPYWRGYRITHNGNQWQVNELTATAPAVIAQPIAAANDQNTLYTPSDAALRAAKDMRKSLKSVDVLDIAAKITIRTPEHFLKETIDKPQIHGATLVIDFLRGGLNVAVAGQMFYFKDMTPDRMTGDTILDSIAVVLGGTVPIHLEGPFTMYRIE